MLSKEDDELLTRTGAGTAMGDLLRRYWIPVLQSGELAPGGRVKRVQLLGERLIAYRTPGGTPGLIGEFCPHRGASLYWGRVEQVGMRCAYHGWKFGLDGQCVDMPSEPRESSFAAKVCHTAYPCAERGGESVLVLGSQSDPKIKVARRTMVAVVIHGHSTDHQVLNSLLVQESQKIEEVGQ